MNRLLPAAAAAAILVLTGCGGGATAGATSSAPTTAKVFTADQTCAQLFANGDEGRMFGAVNFLAALPDEIAKPDQTKAKIFATDLEYVGNTANDELKPLIAEMAKPLNDLAAADGTKFEFVADPFKAAATKVLDLCPKQAKEYDDDKAAQAALEKAEADIAARKAAEAEAAAKKAADEAAAKAAAEAPKEYAGFGDDVVTITKHGTGAQVAIIQHTGGSNFAVHTLDATMDTTDLLVNEIGNYSGTVLFDTSSRDQTTALKITAGGNWTVKLVPLSSVRSFDGATPMTGHGDDVFYYKGAAKPATFTHNGSSNIAVHTYGSRPDLLINEIGAYTGTVVWSPGLYKVTADGDWSATLK